MVSCFFFSSRGIKRGVSSYTSVSRPQLKSYQVKDKVVPNNSQVKFNHKEVEEHHSISSISRKTKSVTACNDSSKSRTLNVNAVRDKVVAFKEIYLFCERLFRENDLLTGDHGFDLYTISLKETLHQLHCFLAKASANSKHGYGIEDLSLLTSITSPYSQRKILWQAYLSCPMRVASINGKKYILVIVDDYSRYTWTLFLRSKDEIPEVLKDFLTMIQRNLQARVISVCTDRGTKFLNKTLHAYFKEEGIEHQTSTARTPEQNGVVERRNRTLVEAA
ncbi:retrovirus-related pol polyprotein from transposon TNT 1-94 [Tanacetum coccineum]